MEKPAGFPHPSTPGPGGSRFSPLLHRFRTAHPEASVEMSALIFSRNASSVAIRSATRSQA